jgi:tetratricopeptide (TPR) repeat protein
MMRIYTMMLLLSLGCISQTAAGAVPDAIVKDMDAGYFQRALTQLKPLLAEHPQDVELQCRYGQALMGIGKSDDAITALKAGVALDPKNGYCHRMLGEAYGLKVQQGMADGSTGMFSAMSMMKSARGEWESAADLTPNDVQVHADLAMYYIMVPGIAGGSYSKAHDQEALIDKLDPIQGLQTRATEAGNKDDTAQGEALLKQAVAEDKTTGSLMALGIFYYGAKHYDDAFKTFREAEAKDPKTYGAWYQIGKTAGLARGNYDEGIESLKHYLTFTDLPDNQPTAAWAHLRLGNIYEYQGHADLAQAEYQTARSLNERGDPELIAQLTKAEARIKR